MGKIAGKEAEANARLIAACPDLLEACKYAVIVFKGIVKPHTVGERCINELKKAIAKAEGESHE